MNDIVDLLRTMRTRDDISLDEDAALDHAIAAVAQRDALVARLGELEKAWREWGNSPDHPTFGIDVNTAAIKIACADDLARVVKENTDG